MRRVGLAARAGPRYILGMPFRWLLIVTVVLQPLGPAPELAAGHRPACCCDLVQTRTCCGEVVAEVVCDLVPAHCLCDAPRQHIPRQAPPAIPSSSPAEERVLPFACPPAATLPASLETRAMGAPTPLGPPPSSRRTRARLSVWIL